MRNGQVLLTCVVMVFATLLAGSAPAHADRLMIVLIDASGSMITPRAGGTNRFEAAKKLAGDRVIQQAGAPLPLGQKFLVAVYTFHGSTTLIPATRAHGIPGFIDAILAQDEIDALTTALDVGGSTPLAGAMCQAIDILTNTDAATQILQVSSDGEENSTPVGTLCQGDLYVGPAPYPTTSWEAQVLNHLTGTVVVKVDLFDSSQISFAAPQGVLDPEGILSPQAGSLASTVSAASGLTPLEEFFTILTQATGGQLTVAHDEEALPVSGDLNNDNCVNFNDAILVARSFGPLVPPVDGRFDLNSDRTVDFTDYLLELSRISPTCGASPYVPRAPVSCTGPQQVVIDGRSIESAGTTINVSSACQVIIKNSLIVSGVNGISINGSAIVKVDNSIIVGQNALLGTTGTIVLSAANSVFHGKLSTNGALNYINRGGNVFE